MNEQPTEPSDKEIGAEDIEVSDAAAKSVVGGDKRKEKKLSTPIPPTFADTPNVLPPSSV